MFLNSFLSGFFYPLNCYTHFAEKVHPLRNALFRYSVTFNNNVANLVTLMEGFAPFLGFVFCGDKIISQNGANFFLFLRYFSCSESLHGCGYF